MSSLEKLAIRGIRSFSPQDEQTIEFYSPLTMIVGQNGSGKTTIIECLKYACTGKLPPGGASTAGQSWVHDPKLTDDAEVKASIKLRFRTQNDRRLVVIRSLQLQYKGKNKTPTFKQLEGVIRNINPITKKSESLSHKCQDLNQFIPQATGISPAILESVVFCHQEESSWPLQDGATLKKKFDDIFEATRYTKALDAIEKCRKVRAEEHKNLRIELAALTENREASMVLLRELEAKTREIQEVQAKQQAIEERIEALAKKREAAEKELRQQAEAAKQVETKLLLLEERGKSLREKKRGLGQEMAGTEEELQGRLQSFARDQEAQQRELNRLRHKETGYRKEGEDARARIQRLTGRRGELKAKMEQLARNVEERNREILALCEKYALPPPRSLAAAAAGAGGSSSAARGGASSSSSSSAAAAAGGAAGGGGALSVALGDAEVKRFQFDLQGKKEELSTTLQRFRQAKGQRLEGPRAAVIELEAKLRANETGRKQKQEEAREIKERLQTATQTLHSQQVVPQSVLEGLRAEAAKERAAAEELQKSGVDRELENQIRALQTELGKLQVDLGEEEKLLDDLRANAKERTLRDKLAQDKQEKAATVAEMAKKFSDEPSFAQLRAAYTQGPGAQGAGGGGNAEEVKSFDDVQTALARATSARKQLHEAGEKRAASLQERRKQLTALQTNLARDRQEVAALEKEIAKLDQAGALATARRTIGEVKDKLGQGDRERYQICEDNDIDTVMAGMEALVHRSRERATGYAAKKKLMEDQIKQARELKKPDNVVGHEHHACPCCTTVLTPEMVTILEETMSKQAAELEKKGQAMREALQGFEVQMATLKACVAGVKATAPLQAKLDEAKARAGKGAAEAEQAEAAVKALEGERAGDAARGEALGRMIAELEKLSGAWTELSALDGELQKMESHLAIYAPAGDTGRTTDDVDKHVKELRNDQAAKRKAIDEARTKQQQHSRKLLAQADLARQAEEKLEAKLKAMSKSLELEKETAQLKERQAKAEAEAAAAVEAEVPLKQELRQAQAEFDRLKQEFETEDAELQRARIECAQRCQAFEALQAKLGQQEGEGAAAEMVTLNAEEQKAEREVRDAEDKARELRPKLHEVAQALQDQDQVRRQIEDNLMYRKMVKQKEQEEAELAALQERLAQMEDRDRLQRSVNSLERQWREAREEKARNEATVDTLTAVQQEQQDKLKSSKYHKVEKRYREAKIKCDTTHMAMEDLHNYHKALDRALMHYHKMKIEEINKIIRELWTRTYQGNDIEEIAIVSGEDAPGGGRATRSYNYRVVMKKGQTLLDMRGRCSAGQRVLASIVIRLALAETFCINCGVMTLDEPTTNLDHDNKGGLARAIARLIAERSKQQNFQLIVITHDEDFVDMVKQELSTQTGFSMPEHYWRISRQAAGAGRAYSKIEQVDWGAF